MVKEVAKEVIEKVTEEAIKEVTIEKKVDVKPVVKPDSAAEKKEKNNNNADSAKPSKPAKDIKPLAEKIAETTAPVSKNDEGIRSNVFNRMAKTSHCNLDTWQENKTTKKKKARRE